VLVSTFALYLALIHVLFLTAIALRLGALGYAGNRVIRLCFFSFALWPLVCLVGIVLHLPVLTNYFGLTAVLAITMICYLVLEARVLLEGDAEKARRLAEVDQEQEAHRDNVASDGRLLADLFPIKTYLGDDSNLMAISDLGRLKSEGIPCRIEGGIVKMLYVREADIARVEQTIAIASQDVEADTGVPGA
jgi:hypothetical protein